MQQEGSDEMVLEDSYITIAWLVLLIILLVVEIITVGLTSIWAAGGALVALIFSILGISLMWQIVIFFVVTFVLLYFTRSPAYHALFKVANKSLKIAFVSDAFLPIIPKLF